jgi:Bacterial tandem repeat domain 1
MTRRTYPKRILDAGEEALIAALQKEFENFTKPDVIDRGLNGKLATAAVPVALGVFEEDAFQRTAVDARQGDDPEEAGIFELGFHKLTQQAPRMTIFQPGRRRKARRSRPDNRLWPSLRHAYGALPPQKSLRPVRREPHHADRRSRNSQVRYLLVADKKARSVSGIFNEVTAQGYKPVMVCGYEDGARAAKPQSSAKSLGHQPGHARHGLTPAQ